MIQWKIKILILKYNFNQEQDYFQRQDENEPTTIYIEPQLLLNNERSHCALGKQLGLRNKQTVLTWQNHTLNEWNTVESDIS
jgi:hypothetical protein